MKSSGEKISNQNDIILEVVQEMNGGTCLWCLSPVIPRAGKVRGL